MNSWLSCAPNARAGIRTQAPELFDVCANYREEEEERKQKRRQDVKDLEHMT